MSSILTYLPAFNIEAGFELDSIFDMLMIIYLCFIKRDI
jgi:hypothetical protein